MSYTRKLARDTIFVFFCTFLVAVFGYLLRVLLARNFSLEQYGMIYAIISLFGIVAPFINLGLATSLTKYIPEFRAKNNPQKIKNSIVFVTIIQTVITVIFAMFFIVFSGYISSKYLQVENAAGLIILYSIFFILNTPLNIIKEGFRGFQKIDYYSLVDLTRAISVFVLTYFLISFGIGIVSVFTSYIIYAYIFLLLSYFLFKKKVFKEYDDTKFYFDKNLIRSLFKFSLPLLLANTVGIFYGRHTNLICYSY